MATIKEGNNNDLIVLLTCRHGGETRPWRMSVGAVAGNDRLVWRPSIFSRWHITEIWREAAGRQELVRDFMYHQQSVVGIVFGVGNLYVARILKLINFRPFMAVS